MNDRILLGAVAALWLLACGPDSTGAAAAASAGSSGGSSTTSSAGDTSSSVAPSSASVVASSVAAAVGGAGPGGESSAGTGGSGGGGESSAGTGGSGGDGGAPSLPTGEECWAHHSDENCLEAGCLAFVPAREVIIADGVCQLEAPEGVCIDSDSFIFIPGIEVRSFEAEGPAVIYFNNLPAADGFGGCAGLYEQHPECCCERSDVAKDGPCAGIVPLTD